MNIKLISDLRLEDVGEAGGKNASLGEMVNALKDSGVRVPEGFVITASAFRSFIKFNELEKVLNDALKRLDTKEFSNLPEIGNECRSAILRSELPPDLQKEVLQNYDLLKKKYDHQISLAVRSSATAEDLPTASFAGQHDSYLNINGEKELLEACLKCFASLYNDRAIKYRTLKGFEHEKVALSVGIQKMVRSDIGAAGVAFTLEPESGHRNMIYITGIWGLGENIVQGNVTPDEFYFFKPSIRSGLSSLITQKPGEKSQTMIFSEDGKGIKNIETPAEKRKIFVLSVKEASLLAKTCLAIEDHYQKPMDIEWAKDGLDGQIYIVQARPETVRSAEKEIVITEYHLKDKSKAICKGKAVGTKIVSGKARLISSPAEGHKLKEGEILVTDNTSPDWNAVLKKASVIITNKGGRTSHASIIARELGLSAVVGTLNATEVIKDGMEITVSCAEGDTGKIYEGKLQWEEKNISPGKIEIPRTKPMFILADPGKAPRLSMYPNMGVGLLRMEFSISNSIRVHPMALVKFNELKDEKAKKEIAALCENHEDKPGYFVDLLSQAVAMVAASFYPKEVIVRMSDFKTNEYANLLGGKQFEPDEENPMLGFRGASRYYNDRYREGFRLECEAMKTVRNKMGFTNVKLMIPFCRTFEEGKKVLQTMEEFGLKRGENGLEVYVMAEIPSNVILADQFSEIFDGFSIGSNDLTQLTLGIDRDSAIISSLFDERNAAAKFMIGEVIRKAKKNGRKIGLCGQAPSDYPEFAQFLVEQGIDSISFNADALIKGIENISAAEKKINNKNKITNESITK